MTGVDNDLANRMRAGAAHFKDQKAGYEEARSDLNSLIFEAHEKDSGPSEIARVTGFTREWVSKVITAEKRRRGIED